MLILPVIAMVGCPRMGHLVPLTDCHNCNTSRWIFSNEVHCMYPDMITEVD